MNKMTKVIHVKVSQCPINKVLNHVHTCIMSGASCAVLMPLAIFCFSKSIRRGNHFALCYYCCLQLLTMNAHSHYRIAGNFRGVKYSLFSWAGWPPRNFNVSVAYRNVGMPYSHETKRNFYSQKLPFLELNEFFTPRNLPTIRYRRVETEVYQMAWWMIFKDRSMQTYIVKKYYN